MTEKIGNYPRPGLESKPTGARSTDRTDRSGTTTESRGGSGSDAISLTDTATRLKSIEARLRELPEVDRERVAEIRQLVESGDYQIDSALIAKRIVQLEQALA